MTPPVWNWMRFQSEVMVPLSTPFEPSPFASKPVPPFGVVPSQFQSTGLVACCV